MYDLYYNKQAPTNITESPETSQGFAQTPQTNSGINTKQTVGIGFAVARILPAGKQVINSLVQSSGNRRIKRAVDGLSQASAIGVELATIGVVGTLAVEGTRVLVNSIQGYIEEITDQTNQEYERQKQGVAIRKFVGVGERID